MDKFIIRKTKSATISTENSQNNCESQQPSTSSCKITSEKQAPVKKKNRNDEDPPTTFDTENPLITSECDQLTSGYKIPSNITPPAKKKKLNTGNKDYQSPTPTNLSSENNSKSQQPGTSNPAPAPLDEHPTTNTASKKKSRSYPFCDKWLEIKEFKNWLTKTNKNGVEVAQCKFCQVILHNHKPHLHRHIETEKHKSIVTAIHLSVPIGEALQLTDDDRMARRAEIKLAALLAKNNLPFLLSDTLIPLIANICPDSKIAKKMTMGRTKSTALVNQVLGSTFMNNMSDYLKAPGNYFSVIMDETTDHGSIKQCAITVIYMDDHLKVNTRFLDMIEMNSGTAEDLTNTLTENLMRKSIPISNLVGFSSDTTNVMVGHNNSVFTKLKEKQPAIACVKCSCHMIHLVASKACLKLPKSLEDMLRNIGAHFGRSFARQKKLQELQFFFKVDIHKILSPATTRWLSLKLCIDRVLEQYPALIAYFRVECFEDPSRTTDSIHATLANHFTKVYLEFMSYALELLNDFNIMFQSESPLLHQLKPETEKLIKTISCNYMNFKYVKETSAFQIEHKNPSLFIDINKVYIGPQAHESLTELKNMPNPPPQADIERVLIDCLSFYKETITEIKSRFDFSDPLFKIVSVVDPASSSNYSPQDITQILDRFPFLKDDLDQNTLIKEWRDYCFLDPESINISKELKAEEYWKKIFNLKDNAGDFKYHSLRKVLGLLLILPFSNASVERVFSKLKRIKTESRTRLNTATVVSLMLSSEGVDNSGGILNFEPSRSMINAKLKY